MGKRFCSNYLSEEGKCSYTGHACLPAIPVGKYSYEELLVRQLLCPDFEIEGNFPNKAKGNNDFYRECLGRVASSGETVEEAFKILLHGIPNAFMGFDQEKIKEAAQKYFSDKTEK